MMNDPVVLEASLALSNELLSENTSLEQKVFKGFRKIICRKPVKKESDMLMSYLKDQQDYFKANADKAEKLIKVGQYKRNKTLAPVDIAAMMMVMQTIYNMEEAITKT
jgi:hypothetical protein